MIWLFIIVPQQKGINFDFFPVGFKQATIESKVTLTHILKEFWVETLQKPEDIEHSFELVSMPHPRIKLQFLRRSCS
jgi:hypothetical protein